MRLLIPTTALFALALAGCPRASTPPAHAKPASEPASKPASQPVTTTPPVNAPPVTTPPPAPPIQTKVALGGPCASTTSCRAGLTCTTDRGACDKPPGCGPDDMCATVCYGVCAAGDAPKTACTTDADCRTFSNYCGGCACDALSVEAKDPKCPERPVNCIMDPCKGKKVRCFEGACSVAPSAR